MTTVAPADETRNARFDIWGAAIVVTLLMGLGAVMRLVLTM